MAEVIIRVELRGDPGADVYKQLHEFMAKKNWRTTLVGGDGNVANLPHAMYAGATEYGLIDLAVLLREQIQTQIWARGAIVLVIAWTGWGQSG